MRRFVPSSVALLGLLVLSGAFVSTSHAQINGVPSSVTSPGFGGRAINGTAPSVTSLGPRGFAPNPGVTFSTPNRGRNSNGHHDGDRPHHHHFVEYVPPYIYAPYPYAIDIGATDDNYDDEADTYEGGPTIFDRRGLGAESYIPPVKDVRPRHADPGTAKNTDADPAPDPPQAPTLLVFKDGRKLEVGNYAIVGDTLFDLTPGHPRKVAIADLDLDATQKQNDDRGVVFRLPQPAQAN